jgi:hypothetical protein
LHVFNYLGILSMGSLVLSIASCCLLPQSKAMRGEHEVLYRDTLSIQQELLDVDGG